jgi:hypothetical protein
LVTARKSAQGSLAEAATAPSSALGRSGPRWIRFFPVRDDSQTAEFLTADGTDSADKGMKISGNPRHRRNPRLIALVGSLVAAESRAGKSPG